MAEQGKPAGAADDGREQARRYREQAARLPEGDLDLPFLVPGEGPLELDVGFGRGLSLLERARQAPGSRLIGLEVKTKWAYKVARRLEREGLHNARAFAGDVRRLLERAGPEGCLSRVFVHFPDPWWKKRHAKRRVITTGFVDGVARLLEDGGVLFVQTDVEPRATSYRDLLAEHDALQLEGEDGLVESNPFGARSNRERRAERDGLPVYRILARRRPR